MVGSSNLTYPNSIPIHNAPFFIQSTIFLNNPDYDIPNILKALGLKRTYRMFSWKRIYSFAKIYSNSLALYFSHSNQYFIYSFLWAFLVSYMKLCCDELIIECSFLGWNEALLFKRIITLRDTFRFQIKCFLSFFLKWPSLNQSRASNNSPKCQEFMSVWKYKELWVCVSMF